MGTIYKMVMRYKEEPIPGMQMDGDGVNDLMMSSPDASEQFDADGDGIGNNKDNDDDNDGLPMDKKPSITPIH